MTRKVLVISGLVVALSTLGTALGGAVDEPAKGTLPSLTDLSLEVSALQALHDFRFTQVQLESLRKLAKETAGEVSPKEEVPVTAELRRTLLALRDALIEDDEERIDELQEELDTLRDKEQVELDADFEVTEEARLHAPEVLRSLSPRQVATFLAAHAEDIPEPLERLLEVLDKVRDLDAKAWKAVREAIAEEVGRAVSGLHPDKASQVGDKVIQLLIHARALNDEQFKAQRPELEATAREIVGNVGPLDLLKQILAQELAELLANPRLEVVLEARLKK